MQIRTPKKYRGVQRRSIIGCRRLIFYLLMITLIAAGIGIALNREVFAPVVQDALYDVIRQLEDRAATMSVPEPTPTMDPRNQLIEADNYWRQGALGTATELYQEIAPSLPNSVEIYRRIALGLINSSRYAEAASYAERAINADPFNPDGWAIQAWALDWDLRAKDALASALHALELDPEHSRAQAYLAEIYLSLGQAERGEALVEALLEDDPNSAEAYRARGLIRQEYRFDYDGAREDFQTAYGMADNMNLFAVDIAILESNLRNYDVALDFLSDVLEANPQNEAALLLTGKGHWGAYGNPAQAQRYLQDCVDFNPQNLNCQFWLGYMQNKLGSIEEASLSFEKAIELGSVNPQHYYWAGFSQILLGNCSRALAYLEPGLRLALQTETQRFAVDIETVIPQCDPTFAGRADAASDS
ncbi:MAG: tetratricopeptide repeat protein [Chloroflexi bacterium]|nr:tetratricopeptide repeat protein [Chloroflexota bacterium]